MAREPGQQPGESNRDYMKRMRDAAARQKQEQRDRATQDRLDHEAREARADAYADQDADAFLQEFLGTGLGEVRKQYSRGELDGIPDIGPAMKAVEDAKRGRWFDSKDAQRKRVEKAAKKHKTALKKAGKASKKKKGWFW